MATRALTSSLDRAATAALPQAQQTVAIWPAVLVIYATLMPREINVEIAGLYFFMDRIALICALPWIIYKINQRVIRFVLPDWLVMFTGLWLVISIAVNYDIARAITSGGSLMLDTVGGYYLARISFRSLNDIRRAFILAAPGFALASGSLVIESVTHHLFVRPFFISVFGPISYAGGGTDVVLDTLRVDVRMGLVRGYGPWAHPILAGLHLATLLPVFWMSGIRGWPRTLGVLAALGAVFTISSAAFGALMLSIGLTSYDRLTRIGQGLNWRLFLLVLIFLLLVIQFAVSGGVLGFVTRYLTFDPWTALFRQFIWQYGSLSVMNHPVFGIGFEPYERPAWMLTQSVDNHWLLFAMRYGLPCGIAIFSAGIVALMALGRSASHAPATDARFYRGIAISLALLMLMMWTVTLQGGTLTWFTLLLGGCVACAQHSFRIGRQR